jgi:toxin ParE1/3/4
MPPTLRFTPRAEADLDSIAEHTLTTWGERQCARYINALQTCCEQLAANPKLGKACDSIRPGLRCFSQGRHVVFFAVETGGILVARVLHDRMLPNLHLVDDE